MAGDVGQFAAHAVQLKVLSPSGKRFVVSDKTKSLFALMRLSYGLLGVVYEVTLRVRPIQGFAVQTAKASFKDFGKLAPKLLSASAGVKLYLQPFRDRPRSFRRLGEAEFEPAHHAVEVVGRRAGQRHRVIEDADFLGRRAEDRSRALGRFAEFAASNHGIPYFNQTRNATPELVAQRYGSRLAFFNKVRRELDPHDRMLNQYFGAYFPASA